jgi:FtsP/CotA-like multicopper oxidase with cupredoxin domain
MVYVKYIELAKCCLVTFSQLEILRPDRISFCFPCSTVAGQASPIRAFGLLLQCRDSIQLSPLISSMSFPGKTQCIYAREPFLGPCRSSAHPLDEYNCSGNFARLRFINGAANAPLKLWIDKHNMTLVARDGVETIPLNVQFLLIAIGQRLDVMVECTAAPFKYHIFSEVAASFLPEGANNPLITIYASALLSYPNAAGIAKPDFWPPSKVNSDPGSNENELFEYQYKPLIRKTTPPAVRRIVLQYSDTYSSKAGEPLEEWIMNNVTHVMPARPLVQAAYMGLFPNSTVVVHAPGPEGNKRMTNILQLEYGQTYEFVVVGMNGQQHPWHLHGYWLDFVAAGTLNRQEDFVVDGVDECNYPRNVAIKKEVLDSLGPKTGEEATLLSVGDSFTVPRFGYSIFRVTMDNQGPWLFHCHVDWHMGMGMAMIISVEKDGLYPDIVEPPMDFPAYLPLSGFKKASSNSGLGQQM